MSEVEVAEKQKKYGPNTLTEKKVMPWYVHFILCLTGMFNYMLWAGALLCFVSYGVQTDKTDKSNLYLGIVLVFVVIATGCFTYY